MDPQMQAMMQQMMGGGGGRAQQDPPDTDTAETVHISALSLLKMLKHARAGVPMEVMGLMLGEFVDDYTVRVIDVYSMPQSGTGVDVEAVDPVFQQKMLDMLAAVGRSQACVGWYHSHPGFGCWLSSVDVNTAQNFERSTPQNRGVSVVVDPVQSVKGKVVLDAFRTIDMRMAMMGHEPRQTTSNIGLVTRPSLKALAHGLNKAYYQLPCTYRKSEPEIRMLHNVYKRGWESGLKLREPKEHKRENRSTMANLKRLAKEYETFITTGLDDDEVENVGKLNPKHHCEMEVEGSTFRNIDQLLSTMIGAMVF
eukprot:TRINITY_DN66718_c0_g1_i1.p1 TRINITY_DN66718_c0_g1~~TRINITY_DN66718_c0_g1_i1.p1  ORF type:complete len:349 (+),score=132.39 TRINITY_DN66718_c0_g1_i1:119-1048(+)